MGINISKIYNLGIDVGSTTVKTVIIDNGEFIYNKYERHFSKVRETLEAEGIEFLEAEVQMVQTTYVTLDEKGQERMDKMLENLDELDDVMNVYHNSENN